MKRIELTGQKLNRWTVLAYVRNHQNHSLYLCRCDCGTEKEVSGSYLRRGSSKSCGCYDADMKKERSRNKAPHRVQLANVHHSMMQRCYEVNSVSYCDYGARGIRVSSGWHTVRAFREWCAANGWKPGLEIDRVDPNGDYEPANCRFVTRKQNMNNTRRTKRYQYGGHIGTISEIADKLGWKYERVRSKIRSQLRRTSA